MVFEMGFDISAEPVGRERLETSPTLIESRPHTLQ